MLDLGKVDFNYTAEIRRTQDFHGIIMNFQNFGGAKPLRLKLVNFPFRPTEFIHKDRIAYFVI